MLSTALAQGKLAFDTSTVPVIFAGSNTTITNNVSGGNATYTWSITKGVLPAALTLCGTTGIISGVPSAPGSASIEMKVEDSSTPPQVALRPLNLVIQPDAPLFTQPPSLSAKVGVLFSYTFSATGGKTPYAWAVANSTPSLPSGITLDPVTGILSGTVNVSSSPNVSASYVVSVKVTGNNSQAQVKSFTLTVNPSDAPTITTIQLSPDAELGIAYPGGSISASGGAGNYTFQNLSPMPSGLSLSSNGAVTGTANGTVAQNLGVRVKVTDSVGRSSEKFVKIRTLSASVPSITTPSTGPDGSINVPYTFVLTATGGKAPYTWDVPISGNATSGPLNLPPGLSLSANGTISGSPTMGGEFKFYPRVTDANGKSAIKLLTIVIKDPTFAITGTDISSDICGILNQPYSTVNGKSPYAWTLAGAPPSSGVTINATTGRISGNLTSVAPGNYTLTLRVTDSVGQNATASKVLTVRPATPLSWANTSLPTLGAASEGAAYTAKVQINGGRPPYKYVLKSGSTLPPLLTLNASTGEIKGTPTTPGNYTFTITGSDSCTGSTIDQTFSLVVNSMTVVCKPIIQNKCSMVVYTGATVTGGVSPYSWTTTTALPASLVMDPSTGKIQGQLTAAAGNSTVMLKATDKNGNIATGPLNITINPVPPLAWLSPVSPLNLSDAYKLSVYNAVLTLSGGVTPYKFALKAGSALPLGLTLNSTTGKISGTPTSTGNTTFTIVATESSCDKLSIEGVFNLNVLDPLSLAGSTITGNKCSSIAPTLMTLTGGAAPFKWTVSPALPSALSINQTTGVVSGNLTSKAGNFSVGVTVTDKNGKTATAPLGIKILALPTFAWVTTANLTDGYKSSVYNTSLSVTGGIAPYTFSLKSGNLTTAGLSFNATTGVISGTPTKAGNYTFTITAKESSCDKLAIDRVFSLKVFDPVVIGGPFISGNKCSSVVGANYTVTGGAPPFTWSTVPTLPASMSINVTTGRISGNLTTGAGSYSIQATDRNGKIATKAITITINALPPFAWATSANLTEADMSVVYSTNISVTGGIAPYTFSLKSGSNLPAGLSLNSTTGLISGTPTSSGSYSFTIVAKESSCDGLTIERTFSLKVQPACGTTALSGGPGTTINNIRVGTDAGNISFFYDAYTVPDAFKVEANGVVYVNTGSISGSATASFCKPAGVTSIKVTVTGPNGTAWRYTLGCPSGTCSPAVTSVGAVALVDAGGVQTCIVNAKTILPNVSIEDLAKTDHLVTSPFIIGKNEVTNEEYCVFLNAIAKKSDPRGLYNSAMGTSPNGGIFRSGQEGAYSYAVKAGMGNYPIVYVSWFDSARYVNWLSNGSPMGLQDTTTTEDGAYALNSAISGVSIMRNGMNPNTKLQPTRWLLNESEWFTSAYLKPSKFNVVEFWNYPTQSDTAPDITLANPNNLANYDNIFTGPTEVGFFFKSLGTFGTLDQGGNVREWTESIDSGQYRIIRGGSWADAVESMKASESDVANPTLEDDKTGFRVGGAP
jgi:formylglycine-generating enzyme required for sulfatase activity